MPEGFRPSGLRWCGSGAHEVLLLPHAWGGLGDLWVMSPKMGPSE